MRIVRLLEVLLGALFVLAAFLKSLDLTAFAAQIRAYHVISDPSLIQKAVFVTLFAETTVGVLLVIGTRLRGLTYLATLALLGGLSGVVAYAWMFHGLEDCGCFGSVLPLGPGATIAKNAAMVVLTLWAWRRAAKAEWGKGAEPSGWAEAAQSLGALACIGLVAGGVLLADNRALFRSAAVDAEAPFAAIEYDDDGETGSLGDGRHLVAMLSATCAHCKASVEPLNELASLEASPKVVGVVFGSDAELENFRLATRPQFPIVQFESLGFFELIGNEPPRFYLVDDGLPVGHIDVLEPTLENLLDFVMEHNLTPAAEGDQA